MENNKIDDIRTDFKNKTFSEYQKSAVRKELLDCLYNKKVENSCYWAAEYICAGHYSDLWDIIIFFMSKYIHISNPKLPIYIFMRFELFLSIMKKGYADNILSMRNNEKIRKLFGECISILCFSKKTHSFETIKIKNNEEFNILNLSEKLKANSTNYATTILKTNDAKELFIPINEFAYNLNEKNNLDACYWFEWIVEYESISKKRKNIIVGERRTYAPDKYQKDIIWIIWDILILYSKELQDPLKEKIINALLQLFMIKYTDSTKKKRKYLVYFAISILIENIDINIDIIDNKESINIIIKKINNIYSQIKKNEVSPKTDYLFNGLDKNNLQKTIEKLEIMENLTNE